MNKERKVHLAYSAHASNKAACLGFLNWPYTIVKDQDIRMVNCGNCMRTNRYKKAMGDARLVVKPLPKSSPRTYKRHLKVNSYYGDAAACSSWVDLDTTRLLHASEIEKVDCGLCKKTVAYKEEMRRKAKGIPAVNVDEKDLRTRYIGYIDFNGNRVTKWPITMRFNDGTFYTDEFTHLPEEGEDSLMMFDTNLWGVVSTNWQIVRDFCTFLNMFGTTNYMKEISS